jgi:RNA polymerase sigma-70 factor, ECF subfamily
MALLKCGRASIMAPCDAAARAARDSYGKLIAILAARTGNIAAAEDSLSEAFAAALLRWPKDGVPDNPEAWLLAAARRRLIDQARRAAVAKAAAGRILHGIEEIEAEMSELAALPDRRLGLLFVCADAALEPGVRTALMLQTVLGLSAERIAAAFMIAPATMGQRLVRAKLKLREAGAVFALPPREDWPTRLPAVLDAVYAAFGAGWDETGGELAEEAIYLARVLAAALPHEPEALGLLALMLHIEARRPARRDQAGGYVPLAAQDVALWRADLLAEAEQFLRTAQSLHSVGRFQIEAAIQSAHAVRRSKGAADWPAIVALYDALAALTGSDVARLNQAAALAHVAGPHAALEVIARLAPALSGYQPFWALKAQLLSETGQSAPAREAYDQAIAMSADPAQADFLSAARARLAL